MGSDAGAAGVPNARRGSPTGSSRVDKRDKGCNGVAFRSSFGMSDTSSVSIAVSMRRSDSCALSDLDRRDRHLRNATTAAVSTSTAPPSTASTIIAQRGNTSTIMTTPPPLLLLPLLLGLVPFVLLLPVPGLTGSKPIIAPS